MSKIEYGYFGPGALNYMKPNKKNIRADVAKHIQDNIKKNYLLGQLLANDGYEKEVIDDEFVEQIIEARKYPLVPINEVLSVLHEETKIAFEEIIESERATEEEFFEALWDNEDYNCVN